MESNRNNSKSIKRKLLDQLVKGYEFTTQLQLLRSHQHSNYHHLNFNVSDDLDPIDELIAKILSSFHKTISVLDSFEPLAEVAVPIAVEGSRNASCGDDSAAPASCNGGDSGHSRMRLGVGKGKRGCYIRKKRSHTWTVEARKIDEDKYAWRKYGQKSILNSKFPRSYFRCTHKPTHGCKATKQVQKFENDSEMFQITYIGHHTCYANYNDQTQENTEPSDHEIIMESDNTLAATFNEGHVNANVQEEEKGIVKEEENVNGDQIKDNCEGSTTDGDLSMIWQDLMRFDDDHHQNQNHFYNGETSATSHQFTFTDNGQFSSLFDSYCANEGTSAM